MTTTQEKPHQAALWSVLLSAAAVVLITARQIWLGLELVTLVILTLTHRGRRWETRAQSGGSA